jgi:hypothetical protein
MTEQYDPKSWFTDEYLGNFNFRFSRSQWWEGFELPHQCDQWEIGSVDDMEQFIKEAQEALRQYKKRHQHNDQGNK